SSALQVDLLPLVLSDIGDPQVARLPIERVPPRIAQPERPDLGPNPGAPDEWIVGRDRVAAGGPGRDAKHLRQQRAQLLAVALRIALAPAVAEPDVQIAIRAEYQIAAVVVGERLLHEENLPACARVGSPRLHRVLDDVGVPVGIGVVDVEETSVPGE